MSENKRILNGIITLGILSIIIPFLRQELGFIILGIILLICGLIFNFYNKRINGKIGIYEKTGIILLLIVILIYPILTIQKIDQTGIFFSFLPVSILLMMYFINPLLKNKKEGLIKNILNTIICIIILGILSLIYYSYSNFLETNNIIYSNFLSNKELKKHNEYDKYFNEDEGNNNKELDYKKYFE